MSDSVPMDGDPLGGSASSELWDRAQEVFAAWLEEAEDGSGPADAAALYGRYPELEPALRTLHDAWSQMEAAFAVSPARAEEVVASTDASVQARYADEQPVEAGEVGGERSVFDRHLGRRVAKHIPSNAGGTPEDPDALHHFLARARVTARLSHPNVLPLLDLGVDDGRRLYFTTPLVRGVTLREALAAHRDGDPRWSRAALLDVLVQVCDGLGNAHRQGVVHGELQPDSVLLGRFGKVYLVGFGRIPAGASRRGERDDLRSVGVLLQELLDGGRADGASRRGVPPQLAAVRARALADSESAGYANLQSLRDDLVAFRDQRAVQAYRTGPWAELSLWVVRNRALAAVVLLGVLCLSVGLVLLGVEQRRADDEARTAEQGLRTASESVDRLLDRLTEGVLAEAPGMERVSADLLSEALALHERILGLRPDAFAVRLGFATETLGRLARAARATRQTGLELQIAERRSEILRALLSSGEDSWAGDGAGDGTVLPRLRSALVASETSAARAEIERGSAAAALQRLDVVVAEAALWLRGPHDPELTWRLAAAGRVRGLALREAGEDAAANEAFERAMEQLRASEAHRSAPEARTLGFLLLRDLLESAQNRGDDAEVRSAEREALRLLQSERPLAARDELRSAVALCRVVARGAAVAGREDQRLVSLDRAVEEARALVRGFPDRRDSARVLAQCLGDRAERDAEVGEGVQAGDAYFEAAQWSQRAVEAAPREAAAQELFTALHQAAYDQLVAVQDWDRACEIALSATRRGPTPEARLVAASGLADLMRRSDLGETPPLDPSRWGICRSACLLVVQEHRARLERGESSELEQVLQGEAWASLREDPAFRRTEGTSSGGR